ncbi:gamma-soluble NSF attachment protein isoform X2 [Lampetra planeri]
MADRKINEALQHLASAEKCLKTGFLKWKPDYDGAASEFSKAAVAFKNAKQYDQAKEAYLKEAQSHKFNQALFHSAKAYEQAGMMLKEMQRLPEAVDLIERASTMYLENGTPDTAAIALERAGKMRRGCAKLQKCWTGSRGSWLDEAVVSLQKEKLMCRDLENYATCNKKTISQVLVHLHRNDYVAAEKCVRESYSIPGFTASEDCAALEQLLEAFDQQDPDAVFAVCSSPLFKYMDNDYTKLARSLQVVGVPSKRKVASPLAGSGGGDGPQAGATSPGGGGEEDDEYAGGLC